MGNVVIWGMATKGVMLANLIPVAGGIDINPNKQGKFAATSGIEIHPPEWLTTLPDGATVLVMNPNYFSEIQAIADELGASVQLVNS
jgi:hypothetical protein